VTRSKIKIKNLDGILLWIDFHFLEICKVLSWRPKFNPSELLHGLQVTDVINEQFHNLVQQLLAFDPSWFNKLLVVSGSA